MFEIAIAVGALLLGFVAGALFYRRHKVRLEAELATARAKLAVLEAWDE